MPSASEVLQQIDTMEKKIARLENLVKQQNEVIQTLIHKNTEMPNNALLVDNFFLRSFIVWGHNFVADLVIAAVLTVLFFCGSLLRIF